MRKKEKKQNVAKRKRPVFACFKWVLKFFIKKPKIFYIDGKPEESSIILANHVKKKGPMVYDMYFPVFTAKWGAGEMLGSFKERYHYLRDVYYMQKLGYGKKRASFISVFEAFFSKFIYKGLGVIGTFHDMRLKRTIEKSIDTLEKNTALLIFPENSDNGYLQQLTEVHSGFTMVCKEYRKRYNKDVPIYAMYYCEKKNIILVDKACYYSDFVKHGLNRKQIAEHIKNKINSLFSLIETNSFLNLQKNVR